MLFVHLLWHCFLVYVSRFYDFHDRCLGVYILLGGVLACSMESRYIQWHPQGTPKPLMHVLEA